MPHKNKLIVLLALTSFAVVGGYALLDPLTFGICQDVYQTSGTPSFVACHDTTNETLGGPLFFGGTALLVVNLILFFLSQKYFNVWKYFAMVYIPIVTIVVVLSPVSQTGGYIFSVSRSLIALVFAGVFVVISLIIFGVTFLSSKK
jgi:hypothetical protein